MKKFLFVLFVVVVFVYIVLDNMLFRNMYDFGLVKNYAMPQTEINAPSFTPEYKQGSVYIEDLFKTTTPIIRNENIGLSHTSKFQTSTKGKRFDEFQKTLEEDLNNSTRRSSELKSLGEVKNAWHFGRLKPQDQNLGHNGSVMNSTEHVVNKSDDRESRRKVVNGTSQQPNKINVLNWDSFRHKKENNVIKNSKNCRLLKPGMSCFFTSNRRYYHKSEAVMIRARHIKLNDMPLKRPRGQKWIFVESEAPTKTWDRMETFWGIWTRFNLTSTFTDDSDVPLSSYRQTCSPNPRWQDCSGDPSSCPEYSRNKTGVVAWVVSHCESPSHRELYVRQLQKHIKVDVYGDCGRPFCGTFWPPRINVTCVRQRLNKYKFYLAFENSFCKDYYTEKFVKSLDMDYIPIVLGLYNYSHIVPKGTFLDVRDFGSPAQLADYLHYLNNNDTAYNILLHARKQVTCHLDTHLSGDTYQCRLCSYLHEHRGQTQIVPDVKKFWSIKNKCKHAEKFYRGIADKVADRLL